MLWGDWWALGNGAMWGGVRTIAPMGQYPSMEVGDPEEAAVAVGETVNAASA